MPVCTIHLLTIKTTLSQFLLDLSNTSLKPLVIARPIRWIIYPTSTHLDPLRTHKWDVLLIVPSTDPLPSSLNPLIGAAFSIQAGVPSQLVNNFSRTNERLLGPGAGDVPPLTGALDKPKVKESAQGLELSPELKEWMKEFGAAEGKGAVSMLNLLSFKPGMKEEYLKYGKAFAETIGSRRGGNAKIVGSVVDIGGAGTVADAKGGGTKEWDEIALAHYPSIWHFADMLASEDYQAVNHKHRVPSLRDTCILCTTELGLPSTEEARAKL